MNTDNIIFAAILYGGLSIACILLAGLFSGFENGIISIPDAKLKYAAQQGRWSAALLLWMRRNARIMLSTVLLGTNLAHAFSAIYFSHFIAILIPGDKNISRDLIATSFLTILMLLFAEITPKMWFRHAPLERCAPTSFLIGAFYIIAWPLIRGVAAVVNLIQGFFPVKTSHHGVLLRSDFPVMLRRSEDAGFIENSLRILLSNSLRYDQLLVSDLYIPAQRVVSVHGDMSLLEAAESVRDSGYSRFPVVGQKDGRQVWCGIFNLYDVLYDIPQEQWQSLTVREIMRPIAVIKTSSSPQHVLRLARMVRAPLLIVIDEKTHEQVGIITTSDILNAMGVPA